MPCIRQSGAAVESAPIVRSLGLRFASGHRIDDHGHTWAQVVFAARGVMSVEAMGKQWVVPPSRSVWMPAGVPHSIEVVGETWMRTVYLRPDIAAALPDAVRVIDVSPLLRELLLEVVRMGCMDEADDVHRNFAGVLVAQLARAPELELALPMPADPRARRVASRVRDDHAADAPLAALARGAGASPRTLERIFLKETGLTFGRWRQQARLQHAVCLLAQGASVTTVSFECGYDSPSAFVTMFKRSLGTTPGRYMRSADFSP
ncbi:MAG: AraC family transcriptional regulator [Phycisphaeraceae bacterium]|nr:MAG: AraC family transcriptional regulator [Phycisphaeraceae bacterium]